MTTSTTLKDDAMAKASTIDAEHRSSSFGSSTLSLQWSESWENFKGSKNCSYFEKENGIEVIEWPDLEDGSVQKQQKPSKAARRKKLAIHIAITAAVTSLLWIGGYFCLQKFVFSKKGTEENDNIFVQSAKSNATSPQIVERETFNPSEDETAAATPVTPTVEERKEIVAPTTAKPNEIVKQETEEPKEIVVPTTEEPKEIDALATAEPVEIVVLQPNESLNAGQFRYSSNGRFKVGVTEQDGNLVLMEVHQSVETVIWSAGMDTGSNWTSSLKPLLFLQTDGNLVLRNSQTRKSIWMTRTHGNSQAQLVLDDSGRIAIRSSDNFRTVLWMEGVPRQQYNGPSSDDMMFPIRGAFYYPWYPSTWHVNGHRAHYNTSMGMYSSSDPAVADAHIDAMDYGKIQLSIASWWGPGTNLDRSRLTMLMDETVAQNSPIKWTIYHEDERDYNPTPEELQKDFEYLKKWFAWHEAWAHIDGKPVIFVYNEAGCDVAQRWVQASRGEWYVVLKLFGGFMDCPYQPDSWHQYGVGKADGIVHNPGHSFVLSPGFWLADTDIPYLERVNRTQFCQNTKTMVESAEQWQLIVSFNEAGEGTLIEPSPDWKSDSGYGDYLDCLHNMS